MCRRIFIRVSREGGGGGDVNKQMLGLMFQFLRFFLILFLLLGRRKWILNIEVDYDTVCESFRGIKLSYSLIRH